MFPFSLRCARGGFSGGFRALQIASFLPQARKFDTCPEIAGLQLERLLIRRQRAGGVHAPRQGAQVAPVLRGFRSMFPRPIDLGGFTPRVFGQGVVTGLELALAQQAGGLAVMLGDAFGGGPVQRRFARVRHRLGLRARPGDCL